MVVGPVSRTLRWWPLFGVAAMLLLGWAVGKDTTAVDDWFFYEVRRVVGTHPSVLLLFTDLRLLGVVSAICRQSPQQARRSERSR